ncbi:MAG: hypothetical protein ACI4FZ_08820 [Lachnospiraceae bacterium]
MSGTGEIDEIKKSTNVWDFLCVVFQELFNIKIRKVAALYFLWLLLRDVYFTFRLPKDFDFSSKISDEFKMLQLILGDRTKTVVIFVAIILVLVVVIISLIVHIIHYRKEIDRMAEVRSEAMHGITAGKKSPIARHVSSNIDV